MLRAVQLFLIIWAAQDGLALGARTGLAKDEASAGKLAPLTQNMKPADFTNHTIIPLSPAVIGTNAGVMLLVVSHEIYVAHGAKPLLANHERSHTLPFQCLFLYWFFLPFLTGTFVVPLSLDFTIAMGHSATASGVFLSAGAFWVVAGIIAGRSLTTEQNWNQARARKIFIYTSIVAEIGYLANALVLQSSVHWGIDARSRTFCFILLSTGVITFLVSMPSVAWSTMWNMVTPQKEKTFWMILTQCSRNAGFILGPVAYAAFSSTVRAGRVASPISMMAWSNVGLQMFSLANLVAGSLLVPTVLHPAEQVAAKAENVEEEDVRAEARPEQLPPAAREKIVWHMIAYSFERPFSVAAIEVATIMLLEVAYGWTAEFCGAAFLVVAGASLTFTALSSFLLSRKCFSESTVFFGASMCGLCGVVLLFDWTPLGPGSLLLADAIVYGGASVANGIAEGWASRAATAGTAYSIEVYRVRNMTAVNASRFFAPIVARFLIDFGGRNVYAGLQLVLCLLGTSTVYRTVSLVWQGTRERAENAMVASKASPKLTDDSNTGSITGI